MDVKTLCLGVLTFGEATGYDIKRYFEDAFSHFFVAGFGSIYPALADLAREGMVTCREEAGETQRPARKVYGITQAGHARFLEVLAGTEPRHKVRSEFLVLLYFAHLLTPRQLEAIVSRRLADVDRDLALIERFEHECPDPPAGIRLVAGLGRAVLETTRDYLGEHAEMLLGEPAANPAGAAVGGSVVHGTAGARPPGRHDDRDALTRAAGGKRPS
jgi:DNA-binding PadR family transcriptional regulator